MQCIAHEFSRRSKHTFQVYLRADLVGLHLSCATRPDIRMYSYGCYDDRKRDMFMSLTMMIELYMNLHVSRLGDLVRVTSGVL